MARQDGKVVCKLDTQAAGYDSETHPTLRSGWATGLSIFLTVKSDSFCLRVRWSHELPYGDEQRLDVFVVPGQLTFEFGQFLRDFLVCSEQASQLHKRPHDKDAGFNGTLGVEHAGEHDSAMFSECVWQRAAATMPPT